MLATPRRRAGRQRPEDPPPCLLARRRRRFGCRRLLILLRRDGIALNHKKPLRLYREEGLSGRRRGGRKRAIGTRAPLALPQGPDRRCSLDLVSDVPADGRRFQGLVVDDNFTRECPARVVDTAISDRRVARECRNEHVFRGLPMALRIIDSLADRRQ